MRVVRSRRVLLAAVSMSFLASASLTLSSEAGCPGADHIAWRSGRSLFHYVQGGEQGVYDVTKTGNLVLAAEADQGVIIFETSPDGAVTPISSAPGHARAIEAAGSYAYVADAASGLCVLNLSNPHLPAPAGSVPDLFPWAMTLAGAYLYCSTDYEIQIVQVTNPNAPTVVAALLAEPSGLALHGTYLYAVQDAGLRTIDVSDPLHPVDHGIVFPAAGLGAPIVNDGFLYVPQASFGIRVLDVTTPLSPVVVAGVPMLDCTGLIANGSRLLAGRWQIQGFQHVDISDPFAPLAGGIHRGATFVGGVAENNLAYLACGYHGLQVMDLGIGTNAPAVFALPSAAKLRSFAPLGSFVVGVDDARLAVLDAANPSAPTVAASLSLGHSYSIAVQGTWGYVLGVDQLRVVDFALPTSPSVVATLPVGFREYMAVSGSRIYLSNYLGEASVFDITLPASPIFLDDLEIGRTDAIAADGMQLFRSETFEAQGTITQLDLTNPSSPDFVDSVTSLFPVTTLRAHEGDLFAGSPFGLYRCEIGSLGDVTLLGDMPGADGELAFGDGNVHVLNRNGGFHSVSSVGALEYLGSGAVPSGAGRGIAEVAGYLYVTDDDALHVYEFPCGVSGAPESPAQTASVLRAEPNPTFGETRLVWSVKDTPIRVELFDAGGRLVRTLLDTAGGSEAPMTAATGRELVWDGLDSEGRQAESGVLFARLSTGKQTFSQRLVVLRSEN